MPTAVGRIKVGFTLNSKHIAILKGLATYAGVTQGEVLEFLLDSAKEDIDNVAERLKAAFEDRRQKALESIKEM
jgi:hypothetical protein